MVAILTDDELRILRHDFAGLLPQSVQIQRATETVSAAGGVTPTWATQSTVKGRIDPLKAMGAIGMNAYTIADQEKGRSHYQLSVQYDADLRDGDRVLIDGVTYEIRQLHRDVALSAVRRALCVRFG